jgi:hypothetical protein
MPESQTKESPSTNDNPLAIEGENNNKSKERKECDEVSKNTKCSLGAIEGQNNNAEENKQKGYVVKDGDTVYRILQKELGERIDIGTVNAIKTIHPDNSVTTIERNPATNNFEKILISPGDTISWDKEGGVLVIRNNIKSVKEEVSKSHHEYAVKKGDTLSGILKNLKKRYPKVYMPEWIEVTHLNGEPFNAKFSDVTLHAGDVISWEEDGKLRLYKNRSHPKAAGKKTDNTINRTEKSGLDRAINLTLNYASKGMPKEFKEGLGEELKKIDKKDLTYKEFDKICTKTRIAFTRNYISKMSNKDFAELSKKEIIIKKNPLKKQIMSERIKGTMGLYTGPIPSSDTNENFHEKYKDAIEAAHKANKNIPILWIEQIIWIESHGFPFAHSSAGAIGLMQTMPSVFIENGGTDNKMSLAFKTTINPYNPTENIMRGALQLAKLRYYFKKRYKIEKEKDLKKIVFQAYNAGVGNIVKLIDAVKAENIKKGEDIYKGYEEAKGLDGYYLKEETKRYYIMAEKYQQQGEKKKKKEKRKK